MQQWHEQDHVSILLLGEGNLSIVTSCPVCCPSNETLCKSNNKWLEQILNSFSLEVNIDIDSSNTGPPRVNGLLFMYVSGTSKPPKHWQDGSTEHLAALAV